MLNNTSINDVLMEALGELLDACDFEFDVVGQEIK